MATLTSKVTNNLSTVVDIFVPGYNPTQPMISIPGSAVNFDLLAAVSYEQLWALQSELAKLITEGTLVQTGTFNTTSIEASAGITQLTGDVTAGPGSGSQAATLATVNPDVGSFTNANITVNAKGLITSAASGSAGFTPNVVQTFNPAAFTAPSSIAASPTTATITPSASSSRVKITINGNMMCNAGQNVHVDIYRNNSVSMAATYLGNNNLMAVSSTDGTTAPGSTTIIDSPATTSATIYTVWASSSDGAGSWSGAGSSIILEEVFA